jgi:arylsulfatase A-like enzyme
MGARLRATVASALILGASATAGSLAPAGLAVAPHGEQPPNLILILTDDQTLAQLRPGTMPAVTRILGEHGVTFSDAVTQSLCCPSRAGLLTGQYPHNNGVFNNVPGYRELVGKGNTLPVWLRQAGYRTSLVGKFLNGYAEDRGARPAPGFTDWFNMMDVAYYGATISDNGTQIQLGQSGARNYVDNVFTDRALELIRQSARARQPLFLWLSYLAPHTGGPHPPECPHPAPVPAPQDIGKFADEPLPEPPSFDEADVSDKPPYIAGLEPIHRHAQEALTTHWRCALESLGTVDRGVRRITGALKRAGQLSNTVLVFTSDNGLYYGEHRLSGGKGLPYEEGVRVPLVVRVPKPLRAGARAGRTIHLPVAGVDVAPTLLRLAGAEPCRRSGDCRTLDGRSLLPLLHGAGNGWPGRRGVLLELARGSRHPNFPCVFNEIRTPTKSYTEYPEIRDPNTLTCVPSDEAELYDLEADPFELDNLLFVDPQGSEATRAALAARLDALRDCAGIAGRDPLPPSGHYCE